MDAATEASPSILVVDDDQPTRTLLRRLLTTEGYAVEEAGDGAMALEKVAALEPDLILLDIMMPDQDGLDVLERLRHTSDVPVILLTAKADEADRVVGFRFGADDYVVKPFSSAELAARIAAVLRRARPDGAAQPAGELEFDGLRIDQVRREVTVRGSRVDLPAREYEVLAFLATSPRQVFSREQLLDQVWRSPADIHPGTVTEHVGRLRRHIEEDPERPRWIRTVRGVGYAFEP
ncbi:MAG TPA: response regulator transcription factor [Acidimicrobiales bacterium]|nr:response regulator transcription factor [Acidimicrobiales bacterium]